MNAFVFYIATDIFKEFKHCEMKIHGEVEVKLCTLILVLDGGDLLPLLSSHHIYVEEFPIPYCVEDILGSRAGLGTGNEESSHFPCLQLNISYPAHH
jgi:hypothetical protein